MQLLTTALFVFYTFSFASSASAIEENYNFFVELKQNSSVIYERCHNVATIGSSPPGSILNALRWNLVDLTANDSCSPYNVSTVAAPLAVIVRDWEPGTGDWGLCGIVQKAVIAKQSGAVALIVVTRSRALLPNAFTSNSSLVVVVTNETLALIKSFGANQLRAGIYGYAYLPFSAFILTIALLGCLALSFIIIAAHLSLLRKEKILSSLFDLKTQLPWWSGVIAIGIMLAMILLLYFLYDVMVWVVMVAFVILSTLSMSNLLMIGIQRLPFCPERRLTCTVWSQECGLDLKQLLLYPFCLTVGVVWIIYRKDPVVGVILQDLLGACFCIDFLRSNVVLRSMKVTTIVFIFVFIYDVFLVFITPFFMSRKSIEHGPSTMVPWIHPTSTPNVSATHVRLRRAISEGTSVMEQIATGKAGTNGELLPLLFVMPTFVPHGLGAYCVAPGVRQTLLGFGDVVLPGLWLVFLMVYDTIWGIRCKPHFYAGCLGYALGLMSTFAALSVMHVGQPALLYLCPLTLLLPLIVAGVRGEVRQLWEGRIPQAHYMDTLQEERDAQEDEASNSQEKMITTAEQEKPILLG